MIARVAMGHIRFAVDRDCDRMGNRAGASPRRPDCCPADVGYRHRCRARHMVNLVASRGGSVIWVWGWARTFGERPAMA
jgi:hypothetical protein